MNFYILWCVQIILESLPISSSGHRKIIEKFTTKYNFSPNNIHNNEIVEHLMHIPTAIILLIFLFQNSYYDSFFPINSIQDLFWLSLLIFISNLVTGFLYFIFKIINISKFPLSLGFFITAISLFLLFFLKSGTNKTLSLCNAFFIGLAQGLALLPGISRLALTFSTGYCIGLFPITAFLFSLIIQFPLIIAGILKSGFEILYFNKQFNFKINWLCILLITFISFLSYKLLWLIFYLVQHNYLSFFSFYMIIPLILALKLYKP